MSGITEYLYDENGSLVREKEGSKTASYQYDLLNRQTHVRTFEGREQENFYDGEGLRAGIKENGKTSAFLFLNGKILAECDGNRELIRRHLSGLGLSHMEDTSTGVLHTYHQDEQGSTAYITGSDGAAENCYIYDAFGNVLESRENVKNRILYTGQQYDQETGQYYLRARYYNPVIGRFTQEDAYRGDGLNLYAYCGNNPVLYYDPSGHQKCEKPQESTMTEPPGGQQVGNESGTGEYGEVHGHHVDAKAAFRGDDNYDEQKGFSISQQFMKDNDLNHSDMTNKQRELFKELFESGRPNTLEEHTRIAREALKAGGADDDMIEDLIAKSLENLSSQGVTQPTRIPWYTKLGGKK